MAIIQKKTISFVGSAGTPARYGGFETLVEQLSIQLSNNFNIIVFCSTKNYKKNERKKYWRGITRIFIPLKANGFQSIIYDLASLIKAFRISNTIFILGGSASLFLPLLSFFFRKKRIIFHPDGKEWTRKKWNLLSRLYLYLSINTGCRIANYIIADNISISPLYNRYNKKIMYCSYGGDQFNLDSNNSESENFWLTIARAEPENNLLDIAKSFSKIQSQKWILVSNYNQTKFGKHLFEKYKNCNNITFIPATYSKKLLEQYLSNCKGYIHGHSAGGTNPSLTVAMWLNKPLICHNNPFNKNTTHKKALFFNSSEQLKTLINKEYPITTKLSYEALLVANKHYTWNKIANKYKSLFDEP